MDKEKWNHKIITKFGLPKNANIVYFRNPKEFCNISIERINPNHKILMWGTLKRKLRKCKNISKIRLGKINLMWIGFIMTINIDSELFLPDKLPLYTIYFITSLLFYYFAMYRTIIKNNTSYRCRV